MRPGVLGVERLVVVFDIERRQHHVFRTEGFTLDAFALTLDSRSLVGFDDRGRGSIVRWDLSRPSAPPVWMALFTDSQQNVPIRADAKALVTRVVPLRDMIGAYEEVATARRLRPS